MGKLSAKSIGVVLAVAATIIWSFNFIIAKWVVGNIPPVSLAFWRWGVAAVVMIVVFLKTNIAHLHLLKKHWLYFAITGLFGVTLFNTLLYIASTSSPAINLSMIGTTTTPIVSIALAGIFLNEKVYLQRVIGMIVTFTGILILLSKGDIDTLLHFKFTKGDAWVIGSAVSFSIYNILVKKQPAGVPPTAFLTYTFTLGALLLLPAYLFETGGRTPFVWDAINISIIGYLAVGTSVLSFLFWNGSIKRLGAGTTSLFGNLIPIFSTIEAIAILKEPFTILHAISAGFIIAGLVLANGKKVI
ncbi:DMT family transporter [Gynurincola endophyticus]|uniref:DMT family transporter n=1 Tax=Gynurincola endophyticus TaxID=2479004 RepID=UPI000F8C6927|nr:DMT family transporter [Gynurincola endophyticus]